MSALVLHGGRVIDPASGTDTEADVWIADGRIAAVGAAPGDFPEHDRIDVSGLVVCPGLVDLCARLREPGATHKGTIASETRAAVAGGITTVCCPPDTRPVIDTPATVELIRQRAVEAGHAHVRPVGALTLGLDGEYLAPLRALTAAGCVAVGQADRPVRDTQVLRSALAYAATHDVPVLLAPRDPWLATGCAHEGAVATRLGLAAVPVAAETAELSRLLALAADTGARVHVGHLSSAAAVDLLARARAAGVRVTADVAIHQLLLTQDALRGFDTRAHVDPPLRTQADRAALRSAVAEGLIDAICSDHQPHDADAKLAPFGESEPGIAGIETLLSLVLELEREGVADLPTLLRRLTTGPAGAIGLEAGTLAPGSRADVCVFAPGAGWTVEPERLHSRGHNTPFAGWRLRGRVREVLVDGRRVTADGD